jgi:hypothetical protein
MNPQVWSKAGNRLLLGRYDENDGEHSIVLLGAVSGSTSDLPGWPVPESWSPEDRFAALNFPREDPLDVYGFSIFGAATGKAVLRISAAWLVEVERMDYRE